MFIGRRLWRCPRCGYVGEPDSTRLGERLGTAIGGVIGGFVGYCSCGVPLIPTAGKYRAFISGLLFGASTGNQVGQVLDMFLIRVYRCPHCQKIDIN